MRSDLVMPDALLVLIGLAMVAVGLGWALDHRGVTSAFYRKVIGAWAAVPGGGLYRKLVPFSQFRYGGAAAISLMGIALLALGLAALLAKT